MEEFATIEFLAFDYCYKILYLIVGNMGAPLELARFPNLMRLVLLWDAHIFGNLPGFFQRKIFKFTLKQLLLKVAFPAVTLI